MNCTLAINYLPLSYRCSEEGARRRWCSVRMSRPNLWIDCANGKLKLPQADIHVRPK